MDENSIGRVSTSAKDFFLHLGATVTLYVSVGALINLLLSIINYYFPDQLAGSFYAGSIAWPISMLVVLMPILYVLEWIIARDISRAPEKANIWIRRWRIYLTLFLAVALIGGDLIALINTYLNGEITARFVYKVLAVLVVGGAVGKYYFFSIYQKSMWSPMARKVIPYGGAVLVLAAIVVGFVAVGSPAKQRAIRFDNERINNLSSIQWQIINYWQRKGGLPGALNDLNDSLSASTLPTDPQSEEAYGYTKTGVHNFELCADFSLPTQDTQGRGSYIGVGGGYDVSYPYPYPPNGNDNWKHDAGRQCFKRTIDPQLYPVQKDSAVVPAKPIY